MDEQPAQNREYPISRRGFLLGGAVAAASLFYNSPRKVEASSPPILKTYRQSPRNVRRILWHNSRQEGQCIVNDYIVEDPVFDQYLMEQQSLERRVGLGRRGEIAVSGTITEAIEDEQQKGTYKHLEGIFITAKSGAVITNGIEGKLIASATTGPEGEYGFKLPKRKLPQGKFTLFINYEKDERHNPNYIQAVREFQIKKDLETSVGLIPSDFDQEHLKYCMRGYPIYNATKRWWHEPYPLEVVEVYTGPAFDSLKRPTTQQVDAILESIEVFRSLLRKYSAGRDFEVKRVDATLGTRTPLATPGVLMAGFDDSLLKIPAMGGATRYFLNNGSMIIIGGVAHYTTQVNPSILRDFVGTHELGHNAGLEHTPEDTPRGDSVMHPHSTAFGVQKIDIQTFDIHHDGGRQPENEADDLNRLKTTKSSSV